MVRYAVRFPARLVIGVALTLAGLLIWLFSAVQSHHEPRSFTDGGPPPAYVTVTAGHTYSIDVPGGAGVAATANGGTGDLQCTIAGPSGGAVALSVTKETNTKAVNQIATFTAPSSGRIDVRCDGFAQVYVDDADGSFDLAGALVLLATLLLTVGLPLLLSGLATTLRRPREDGGTGHDPTDRIAAPDTTPAGGEHVSG